MKKMVFRALKKICCCCCSCRRDKVPKNSGKNDEASTVMGNASVLNASYSKKTSGFDGDVTKLDTLSDQVDVIQNDTVKVKEKEEGMAQKLLQKEVDNLQNQLYEKTERINELERVLKNKNNSNIEDRSKFARRNSELENQLIAKNLNIIEVIGNFSSAQLLVSKSNRAFEALGVVLQYYLRQIEQITKQLAVAIDENSELSNKNVLLSAESEGARTELTRVMTKRDAEKVKRKTVQSDLDQLAASHDAEITRLTERHRQEQEKLRISLEEEKEDELKKAKEEHLQESERLKAGHRNEILELATQHRNEIQELLQEKTNIINGMVSEHEAVIKTKEEDHIKTIEGLKKNHNGKVDHLNTTLIPYKHLHEELQSLQVVLDLRNEEIRNTRLKTMELERKVDEYYELITKFDALSQQNASLKESLKKRTLSERNLSVERDNLAEKFENEIKKVNLLSMEKDQLVWRVSNPDLSTSLPNVFEDAEDEGCSMSPLRSSGSFTTSPPINFSSPAKLKRRSMHLPICKSDYE